MAGGPILKRLVDPTAVTTTATVIFTATVKTLVRSMDAGCTTTFSRQMWVMLNSLTGSYVWYVDNGLAIGTFPWRGGLVLEPGDYLAVDCSDNAAWTITINGATGLPSS